MRVIKMKIGQMVVSIIGNYSLKNRGDEILLKGTIQLFQHLFREKKVKFNIYLINPNEEAKSFSKEERRNMHLFSPLIVFVGSKVRSLYLLAWSYLYRIFHSNSLLKFLQKNDREKVLALLQSDFIIYRSIDQISDIFGFNTFLNNYVQAIFCYNLKKQRLLLHSQTIYFSDSFGSARKFIIKFLIKMLSKKVKITLRDRFSEEWFVKNRIGYFSMIPPPSITITHEIAKKHCKEEKHKDQIKISITPRISTLKKSKTRAYVKLIESLLLKYPALEVFLMGQSYEREFSDDDYVKIGNILRQINASHIDRIKVFDIRSKSLPDILKLLMDFDCVISERAFTAVSALSLGIPSIILDPYGGKNMGFAKLFGFEKFACSIESFDPFLVVGWIENILANKEQYQMFLRRKAEELYHEAVIKTWRLIQATR